MFGAASDSGFGLADRSKQLWTFTGAGARSVHSPAPALQLPAADRQEEVVPDDVVQLDLAAANELLLDVLPEASEGNIFEEVSAHDGGQLDEGYVSGLSPVSSHSADQQLNSVGNDIFDFNALEENNLLGDSADVENTDIIFDFIFDNPEESNDFNTNRLLGNCQKDPTWYQEPGVSMQKIGVITDPVLHEAIVNNTGLGEGGGRRRHRGGQKRMEAAEMVSEDHKKNVERCRLYRAERNKREDQQLTELEMLEKENRKLRTEEEAMRTKLERAKKVYLDLIVTGRIKFV